MCPGTSGSSCRSIAMFSNPRLPRVGPPDRSSSPASRAPLLVRGALFLCPIRQPEAGRSRSGVWREHLLLHDERRRERSILEKRADLALPRLAPVVLSVLGVRGRTREPAPRPLLIV